MWRGFGLLSGHLRMELMKEVGLERRKEALKRRSQRRNWQDITIHRDGVGAGGLLGQADLVKAAAAQAAPPRRRGTQTSKMPKCSLDNKAAEQFMASNYRFKPRLFSEYLLLST